MKSLIALLFVLQLSAEQPLYFIQIKSYSDQAEALKFVKGIESEGIRPLIDIANLNDRGVWSRVMFGGFKSKKLAEDFIENNKLKNQFPDLWIKQIPKKDLNLYNFAKESTDSK